VVEPLCKINIYVTHKITSHLYHYYSIKFSWQMSMSQECVY